MHTANDLNHHTREAPNFDITDAIMDRTDDVGRLILRLSIGGLMLIHGLNKLFYGAEQVAQIVTSAGIPAFFFWRILGRSNRSHAGHSGLQNENWGNTYFNGHINCCSSGSFYRINQSQ
jgi:hypothetical protein